MLHLLEFLIHFRYYTRTIEVIKPNKWKLFIYGIAIWKLSNISRLVYTDFNKKFVFVRVITIKALMQVVKSCVKLIET